MITNTLNLDKELEAKYSKLFDEVSEKLSSDEESVKIESLEQFFGYIKEIAAKDKKYLRLPLDEPIFEIDADSRKISIPDEFKANGISVQGDHLAEILFFSIDRYFDIMDLNNTKIYVNWKSAVASGKSEVFFSSTDIIPGKIVFGWPIADKLTEKNGALTFAVSFVIEDGDALKYSLNTLSASVTIKDGLILVEPERIDVTNDILNMLTDSQFGENDAAVADPEWIRELSEAGEDYKAVVNLLGGYNAANELESVPADLYGLASVENGASVLYFLNSRVASGENSNPSADVSSSVAYIVVKEGEELNSRLTYFVEADGGYAEASEAQLDAWGTEEAVDLYVACVKVSLSEPGEYQLRAQGIKTFNGQKIGASSTVDGQVVSIPEAAVPSSLEIVKVDDPSTGYTFDEAAKKSVFIDGSGEASLTAKVAYDNALGLVNYAWTKDGEAIVIEGQDEYVDSAESAISISEPGIYKVAVKQYLNNSYAEAVESEEFVASYYADKIAQSALSLKFDANNNEAKVSTIDPSAKIAYSFTPGESLATKKFALIINPIELAEDAKSDRVEYAWYYTKSDDVEEPEWEVVASGEAGCKLVSDTVGSYKAVVKNIYNGCVFTVESESFDVYLA